MPNHHKNGKKRYFLLPQWTTMSHRNSNTPPEQSLSFTFNTLLTSLYAEGMNATDIMSDVFCRSVNHQKNFLKKCVALKAKKQKLQQRVGFPTYCSPFGWFNPFPEIICFSDLAIPAWMEVSEFLTKLIAVKLEREPIAEGIESNLLKFRLNEVRFMRSESFVGTEVRNNLDKSSDSP